MNKILYTEVKNPYRPFDMDGKRFYLKGHTEEECEFAASAWDEGRAEVAREICEAYGDMFDGMGMGKCNFKKSDWEYIEALKKKYLGESER